MIHWLNIRELSSVAEARRRARRAASRIGFNSVKTEHVAIVATEMAQNILRHGGGGRFLVDWFGPPGGQRLVLVGVDEGPGIAKLELMLRDGRTTKNSPGTGLGAMLRLSDRLDIDTGRGKGTLVTAEFLPRQAKGTMRGHYAALRLSYPGARKCGDSVAICDIGSVRTFMVCDGLGHGPEAAAAAEAARETFVDVAPEAGLQDILDEMGEAMRGTRGGVASLVRVDSENRRLDYAGIGNISTLVRRGGDFRRLAVRDGLLGSGRSKAHVESHDVDEDTIVIMHSDGINTLRDLATRTSLLHRSAPLIASRLLSDNLRGRDDASVLVARMKEGRAL
ncbi:SpoIIE family protein phosphatase [Sphingomicrobium arenosum]|uniref:SpoIIE family protein phosphatase n=1 Tax=Sphingomicrobium arenosum TaxID=2233861 RepID=UPI002240CD22|nr:SpoIIE family protein phosphatase [Sphingomicrobium arenosum]